jgi:hypothetical protein
MPNTQEQNKSHQLRKKGDIEALQKKTAYNVIY